MDRVIRLLLASMTQRSGLPSRWVQILQNVRAGTAPRLSSEPEAAVYVATHPLDTLDAVLTGCLNDPAYCAGGVVG